MKIQFIKPYADPHIAGRVYQPGWVAEFTDPDAERAIADGYAKPAPVDAFSRKYAAPNLASSECVVPPAPPLPPAGRLLSEGDVFRDKGERLELDELIDKPQQTSKKGVLKI